jgi:homoserine O-acetyltransferase/O-succinyltransferase
MGEALQPSFEGDFTLERFQLESGAELRPAVLRYAIYGELNADRSNVVLVCHALSGSARVADWWADLFGESAVLDLQRDCVVCVNILGSCYGTSGPASANPKTGREYGPDFPLVRIRDTVRAQAALFDSLGIRRINVAIGASIGGMQAMEWAIQFPERVGTCISIGATRCNALALALNHLQRQAIQMDPSYRDGRYTASEAPKSGVSLARALAMCTYKSSELFNERYGRKPNRTGEDPYSAKQDRFDVAGYLDYQGQIFNRRFDANSYISITKMMDTFDFARGFASDRDALQRIRARVLLVGISSDWLFPAAEVKALAEQMKAAGVECEYAEIESDHGHDAFLAEPEKLFPLIVPEFQRERNQGLHVTPARTSGAQKHTAEQSESGRFLVPAPAD